MESWKTAKAVSLRETAIERMRENDFGGGRKSAVEAQKLCPTLEDMDRMIVVCNVHCAAAEGDDLYKILGVAAEADESAVSSQCSRMALALHPDNNKSPGAAEAFQLFLKAKKVLLNNEQRRAYDSMCRARAMGENSGSGFSGLGNDHLQSGVVVPNYFGSARSRDGFKHQQEIDQTIGNVDSAISSIVNIYQKDWQLLYQMNAQNQQEIDQIIDNAGAAVSSIVMNDPNFQPLFQYQTEELMSSSRKNYISNLFDHYTDKFSAALYSRSVDNHQMNAENVVQNDHTDQPSSKDQPNVTRGLKVNEASGGIDREETAEEADRKGKRVAEFEPASVVQPDSKILKYREFYDFERNKCITRLGEGQVWAVYDTLDAMPRSYALINSISDDHTIHITWLKPLPNNDDEKQWLHQGFPASIGRFEQGFPSTLEGQIVFSHQVNHKRDAVLKNVHEILPKKGETWAVFKNWDMIKRFEGYEYEVVNILVDYNEFGCCVAFLEKIKGYSCVFGRKEGPREDWKVMQVKDRLIFSHRIPCVLLISNTPNDMFELDPASLSPSLRGR